MTATPSQPAAQATDRLALIALMLGAFSFLSAGLTAIAAIIVGIIALLRIRRGVASGKLMARLGIIFGVVTLVAALITGGVLLNLAHRQAAQQQRTQTVHRQVATARQSVIDDVHDTTANVKAYLKQNPDANLDEILTHATVVNSDPKGGETVVIGDASGKNTTAYKAWVVVGTDVVLNRNANYNYQSYTNTFRWSDNKTQQATDVTQDKTPRNSGALGR